MKNTPIRVIVLLGSLTVVGIIFTQIFWVSEAIKNQEKQFNHNVQMAMHNVAEALCEINGNDISNDPIDQVSSNYFIARTNYSINLSSLEYLLKAEFQKRNLNEDFEFGVYDCQTERMVYGDFVSFGEDQAKPLGNLPKLENEEYYFGVYFPNKGSGLVSDLGFWKFTSLLTVLITVFFGYALFIILRQRRLSEIQRDFINNMTHEFKTPLSTLVLSAEVLSRESTSDRGKKYAEIVRTESERLQAHVSRFLDASKIEHDSKAISEKIDLYSHIKAVVDRFSAHGKELRFHPKGESPTVEGNPYLLDEILFNLIDNAIKYGKSYVTISSRREGKWVLMEVSNDGSPIPEKDRSKIFTKFYRVSQGDLHDVKGFGLGLYFVKQAARSLRGKIGLRSDEKETTFTLKIPAVK